MSIVDSRPELKRMSRLEGGIPRSGASGRTDAGESADVQPLRRPDTYRRGGRPAPGPRLLVLNERCHRNPLAGGAETHLFEVFPRLVEQGMQVDLLCCGFDGAPEHEVHRGVAIHRIGRRVSYYARVPFEVRRRLAAGTVDLVVEDLNKLPFLTPLHARVPVVVMHHHLHGLTAFRQVGPHLAAASVALEQLIPLVYRRCRVVTVSPSSKIDLVRRGLPEERIDVALNGIDHALHRPAPLGGRRPHVVVLGRVEPYKRVDLVLRALPRIVAAVPDVQVSVVGRGQETGRLRRLARSLGVEQHVRFHGFVSEERKVQLLQDAALLVQCSRKEGWGLTVVEAYACGTPVVATDVPGLRDSVQDGMTGLLVRRARPAALAAAVNRLLLDEPKRLQLARFARVFAMRFSWDASARDVASAVHRAVADRRSARGASLLGRLLHRQPVSAPVAGADA